MYLLCVIRWSWDRLQSELINNISIQYNTKKNLNCRKVPFHKIVNAIGFVFNVTIFPWSCYPFMRVTIIEEQYFGEITVWGYSTTLVEVCAL